VTLPDRRSSGEDNRRFSSSIRRFLLTKDTCDKDALLGEVGSSILLPEDKFACCRTPVARKGKPLQDAGNHQDNGLTQIFCVYKL